MGAKLGSSDGPMADMNVTPLIDVVLVLLVVFMVITPLLQAGLPVEPPEVPDDTMAEQRDAKEFITVSVTSDGRFGVEDDEATLEDLIDLLNAEFDKDRDAITQHIRKELPGDAPQARVLLLKADRELKYRQVREVMDLLSANQYTSIQLAVSKEK
ncbi:MAG: biopolymer transporter ExbD [Myxococcota bacterium]